MSSLNSKNLLNDKTWLEEQFVKKERSTSDIAKELELFPMQVRRACKKFGFALRDKSTAQSLNLEHNGHPLQGVERSEAEKEKISMGIQSHWESLSDAERANKKLEVAKRIKNAWASKDEDDKKETIKKLNSNKNKASREGSKLEKMIIAELLKHGIHAESRATHYVSDEKFEIDIAIYKDSLAIEVDGPTHWDSIYGEENLKKVKEKDSRKDKMLNGLGWKVLRLIDKSNNPTRAVCRRAVSIILDVLEQPKNSRDNVTLRELT